MAKVGSLQITSASEYSKGEGFVIEQLGYYNQSEPSWAIPAWDEMGYPDLAEIYPTVEAAQKAIDANNY